MSLSSFQGGAALIVPVLKAEKKTTGMCGDYELRVTQASELEESLWPRVDDLLSDYGGNT